MIISRDAEISFDKISNPFMIKVPKLGIEETYLNMIMVIYDNLTVSTQLNGERLKAFLPRLETRQLRFNMVLEVIAFQY